MLDVWMVVKHDPRRSQPGSRIPLQRDSDTSECEQRHVVNLLKGLKKIKEDKGKKTRTLKI